MMGPRDSSSFDDRGIRAALSGLFVLALTLWGEARASYVTGKGWEAAPLGSRLNVASVIVNRVERNQRGFGGDTVKGVCLKRWQFSCWEPSAGWDDPRDDDLLSENYEAVMRHAEAILAGGPVTDPILAECIWIAALAEDGLLKDSIHQATHYYSPRGMKPRGREPNWAASMRQVAEGHGHKFFV